MKIPKVKCPSHYRLKMSLIDMMVHRDVNRAQFPGGGETVEGLPGRDKALVSVPQSRERFCLK